MTDPHKTEAAEPEDVKLGVLGDIVGFRFRRVQNAMTRAYSRAIADKALRAGTFSCLAIIAENKGISQNDLGRAISIDKTAVMQIIDEIEDRGLGVRVRSKVDRRRHSLYLTKEGEDLLAELAETVRRSEAEVLAALDDDDFRDLHRLLTKMYAGLAETAPSA